MLLSEKKFAIILLGPPGAGKGTQAQRLAKMFAMNTIATSSILHEKVRSAPSDQDVQLAKQAMESGKLVDPRMVTKWIIEEVSRLAQEGKSVILDGSPRTLYEAEQEYATFKKEYGDHIYVLFIFISENSTVYRNTNRRVCEQCGRSVIYAKETAQLTMCPECGSRLVRRTDDTAEVVKARIEEYNERTLPVILFFKEKGVLIEINGEQTVEEVFYDIVKHIDVKISND